MDKSFEQKTEKAKGRGGRKRKPDAQKAIHKVGSFWLTSAEKARYTQLFQQSGLENQTEFFRRVMFGGALKLYYRDQNSERIYESLLRIEKEINQIGINYNQVVKRVHAVSSEQNVYGSLKELKELTDEIKSKLKEIIRLYDECTQFPSK